MYEIVFVLLLYVFLLCLVFYLNTRLNFTEEKLDNIIGQKQEYDMVANSEKSDDTSISNFLDQSSNEDNEEETEEEITEEKPLLDKKVE